MDNDNRIEKAIETAMAVLGNAPEIHPGSYDHDQIYQLNTAANEAYKILYHALADNQLPPAPVAEEMEEMECTTCHNDGLNCNVCGYDPDASAQPAVPDVDALAQHIRKVDGNNDMGAGALAESICNWIEEQ